MHKGSYFFLQCNISTNPKWTGFWQQYQHEKYIWKTQCKRESPLRYSTLFKRNQLPRENKAKPMHNIYLQHLLSLFYYFRWEQREKMEGKVNIFKVNSLAGIQLLILNGNLKLKHFYQAVSITNSNSRVILYSVSLLLTFFSLFNMTPCHFWLA